MTLATRITLVLTLLLGTVAQVAAQEAVSTDPPPQTTTATATAAAVEVERPGDRAIRENFLALLDQHPREVSRILALDPLLLHDDAYLARYPKLAAFVAENPEIRSNPHYFVPRAQFEADTRPDPLGDALEGLAIFTTIALVTAALAWFVRTVIEQRRWSRLARRQTEVHSKILDRFGTTAELLEYIKTPAGSKFLESAPIPVYTEQPRINTPNTRLIWTVQIGVVITAVSFGLLILGAWFEGEAAAGFFAMGVIAFSIGVGFIASAAASMLMSRRLGLGTEPPLPDDRGLVR
jgi:hypothetical protein